MISHLVSYSGREQFELDISKLDPKDKSIGDRNTLFFYKNTTWEISDSELELLKKNKEYFRWCHVHVKAKKAKLDTKPKAIPELFVEDGGSKLTKKTTKKP